MTVQDDTSVETLIRSLDIATDTAMYEQNMELLERLLADDFIYTHSTDRSDPKESFVGWIGKREGPPQRLLSDVQVEVHEDVAVTRGNLDIVYADESRKLLRYVRVYRLRDGTWRLISNRTLPADDRQA